MQKFFPISVLRPVVSTGTWAYTVASDLITFNKTAADATPNVHLAIPGDKLHDAGFASFRAVKWHYSVGTADLDAVPTFGINKITFPANVQTVTALTTDTDDTEAVAQGSYAVQVTVVDSNGNPQIQAIEDDQTYFTEGTFNCGASTVFKLIGLTVIS